MKVLAPLVPLVALLLTGCNDSSKPGNSNLADAPGDYLKNAAHSQQQAVKTIDLVALNKAIESFYVQEGRFPTNLDEMKEKDYLHVIPVPPAGWKLDYDATNGVVKLAKE
jgi:hypothetical protein